MDRLPDLDDLDASTLTALLRDGPAQVPATVIDVWAEPLGATTGFLGVLRRLHLRYQDPAADAAGGPDTLVAKAPTSDPGGRQVGLMLNVWARESRFFAELAPRCGLRVPRCFANLADDEAGRWLLLLEDVGDTTAPTQAEGATKAQSAAALAEIAKLHRTFADARPTAWLPGFDRGPLSALEHAVRGAVEPFLARFGDLLPPGGADLLRRFAPRLASWGEQQAQGPLTVVHADYRLDNLIIDRDHQVAVLDWQTALMGNATMDVASLLATSLATEDRRAWENELLTLYADASGHTIEHVRLGVRHHYLWWMALFANNLSKIDPADERGQAMFEHTVRRTFAAAADHGCGQLLDAMDG